MKGTAHSRAVVLGAEKAHAKMVTDLYTIFLSLSLALSRSSSFVLPETEGKRENTNLFLECQYPAAQSGSGGAWPTAST